MSYICACGRPGCPGVGCWTVPPPQVVPLPPTSAILHSVPDLVAAIGALTEEVRALRAALMKGDP